MLPSLCNVDREVAASTAVHSEGVLIWQVQIQFTVIDIAGSRSANSERLWTRTMQVHGDPFLYIGHWLVKAAMLPRKSQINMLAPPNPTPLEDPCTPACALVSQASSI